MPHEKRRTVVRFFLQEYLESSLRYLHHKFVEDVNDHRTDNIKASTHVTCSINSVGYTRTDCKPRLFAGFTSCVGVLLSSHRVVAIIWSVATS